MTQPTGKSMIWAPGHVFEACFWREIFNHQDMRFYCDFSGVRQGGPFSIVLHLSFVIPAQCSPPPFLPHLPWGALVSS